jgi:hypothetical protein
MADLTITPENVKLIDADTNQQVVQFGEAVTQGQAVYLKASDAKYWLAQNDDIAEAEFRGIVITPAGVDGYGVIATGGLVGMGATLVQGEVYVVSGTGGGVAPISDLGSAVYTSIIGVGATTANLRIDRSNTGILQP